MKDSASALADLVDTIPSCNEVTLATLMPGPDTGSGSPMTTASCEVVRQKCPEAPALDAGTDTPIDAATE